MNHPGPFKALRATAEALAVTFQCPEPVLCALAVLLHEPEPVRLEDLAQQAGVSKFHLCRLFTRHIGVPPATLHRALRLASARQRLAAALPGGRVSLSGLAVELGWSDQSHFTNAFRRAMGAPPAAYARAHCVQQR